jgi:hypothetical protein
MSQSLQATQLGIEAYLRGKRLGIEERRTGLAEKQFGQLDVPAASRAETQFKQQQEERTKAIERQTEMDRVISEIGSGVKTTQATTPGPRDFNVFGKLTTPTGETMSPEEHRRNVRNSKMALLRGVVEDLPLEDRFEFSKEIGDFANAFLGPDQMEAGVAALDTAADISQEELKGLKAKNKLIGAEVKESDVDKRYREQRGRILEHNLSSLGVYLGVATDLTDEQRKAAETFAKGKADGGEFVSPTEISTEVLSFSAVARGATAVRRKEIDTHAPKSRELVENATKDITATMKGDFNLFPVIGGFGKALSTPFKGALADTPEELIGGRRFSLLLLALKEAETQALRDEVPIDIFKRNIREFYERAIKNSLKEETLRPAEEAALKELETQYDLKVR